MIKYLFQGLGYGIALGLVFLGLNAARAETMVVERIVPPGASLSYSEGGTIVRTIAVPEGRVRVTIEFSGSIRPGHGRRPR